MHLVGGGLALGMLPRGFALDDIHLWSNTIIPAASCLAVVATLLAFVLGRSQGVRAVVAIAAGGWLAAVATGALLFPLSMPVARLAVPALVALALLALAWWARARTAVTLVAIALGAALGGIEIFAQRAPPPSTHPLGGILAEVTDDGSSRDAFDGTVTVPCGTHQLGVNPVLTFTSRSPDRTWTILAPGEHGSHRTLARYTKTANGFRAAYNDDGQSSLVGVKSDDRIDLDAVSTLPEPVYAHLDAFTSIDVSFEATLTFSPTGATRFPIEPADYPSGRPVQLAYVDANRAFHVVRASDAEKGPFDELANGHLARGEALTLEIRPREDGDDGCRLTFEDWSAQVSTEPSPTAGWGVPQGSIQFFSRGAQGLVVLTLAETGPGRGFDSVGHAAGTYRNRVRVEPIR